ncbi:hydrolase [Nocardia sp. 852002-20019_SCH5090214]|uniref:alpha/beta fold hydrolase n=1 Tax=Nocardia TaxID=1817 RepID=UPI0007EA83AA|nr:MULTISPECIES: alpha/beta hydrolase [Nocardia]OBF83132.1 hydrolase [Mycobacterium sp. 852002-51759_SCH5129042]MBF6273064.1 alpha/beta hydrolase [Nocardia nova]MBV7703688.1 alpha/beta hydrolase [Nocardia nova]OBA41358.1 hydrolase [Nocardia sp. 852002-51101_SCH5132738]OBA46812.1 hydrolase [Nocardia sp. 852002-20019_SCH5090214]
MPIAEIRGGEVYYEILGESGPLIVLTPGGRFSIEIPGLRPLAEALVAGGHRVLLWDRPNCGRSEVAFWGPTESHMRAEVLHDLLVHLDTGPVIIAGGSGGARDSILTAMLYPEIATKLIVWNIVGGNYGLIALGSHYIIPNITAAKIKGIEGLIELPEWQERIQDNPKNKDRLLALDAEEFQAQMLRWLDAYVPKPGQTIPGVTDYEFSKLRIPTLIIRGGEHDIDHPKRTSMEVHCLIEGSVLIDPPWPEDAWQQGQKARARGEGNIFDTWVLAAPAILDFVRQ